MLTYMRKKSKSWITKFIFGAIIIVFVFWGGSTYWAKEANKVAKVDRHVISVQQYQKAYGDTVSSYQKRFGDAFTPEMIEKMNLKEQVLDNMIDEYIIEEEAKKLGITISDEELQAMLENVPAFNQDGVFNNDYYKRLLDYERITPREFEGDLRRDLLKEKVYDTVTENIVVSDQEVQASYRYKNDTFDLNYCVIESSSFKDDITVGPEEVQTYFDGNKGDYKIPPKASVVYIEFPVSDYVEGIEVPDEKARDYYESHKKDEFMTPAKVHARHILIKVPQGSDEAIVQEKKEFAQKIYDDIKAGQDFAELAKKYSEDPGNSFLGGDIGLVPKDSLPRAMGSALYSMEPGDLKEPVRTHLGFHVLKLEDKVAPKETPFEEVSSTIIDSLRHQDAKTEAHDQANKTFIALYEGQSGDIDEYSKANKFDLKNLGLFSENEKISIPQGDQLTKNAFRYPEGELGDLIDIGTGYIVYMVKKRVVSRIPELDEVKDRVSKDLIKQKAIEKARVYAQEIAGMDAAQMKDLDIRSTGEFKRTAGSIPRLSMLPDIKDELDKIDKPKIYPVKDKVYVVWLKAVQEADITAMTEDNVKQIREELISRKEEMMIDTYMEQVRERHDIVIDQSRLS